MAEYTTLAALMLGGFDYARQNNQLGSWSEFYRHYWLLLVMTRFLILSSPVSPSRKSQVIKDFCGDSLDKNMMAFVDILAMNKRLPLLPFVGYLTVEIEAGKTSTGSACFSDGFKT